MRKSLVVVAGSLVLAACGPGPSIVYVPAPAPAPAPEMAPEVLPPVGITIVDTVGSRLLVSTNQLAYLAIFEIVPDVGVTLIYPASPRQRQVALSGSSRLSVLWMASRPDARYANDDRYRRSPEASRSGGAVHYVYAIASARPLRLTEAAFDDARLREMIGPRMYRAADPYETMGALSRHFVPMQLDEDWGEDVYRIDRSRRRAPQRIAKVYCSNGTVIHVREEIADRTRCAAKDRTGERVGHVTRPDSVVSSNGRKVASRGAERRNGPPVFRVQKPADEADDANGRSARVAEADDDEPKGAVWRRVEQQGKPQAKPEAKPDAKPNGKPEPAPVAKPEAKPEAPAKGGVWRRVGKKAPADSTSDSTSMPAKPLPAKP